VVVLATYCGPLCARLDALDRMLCSPCSELWLSRNAQKRNKRKPSGGGGGSEGSVRSVRVLRVASLEPAMASQPGH
jgi:hypothetical protein